MGWAAEGNLAVHWHVGLGSQRHATAVAAFAVARDTHVRGKPGQLAAAVLGRKENFAAFFFLAGSASLCQCPLLYSWRTAGTRELTQLSKQEQEHARLCLTAGLGISFLVMGWI